LLDESKYLFNITSLHHQNEDMTSLNNLSFTVI